MVQVNLKGVVGNVVIVVGNLHVAGGVGQSIQASHAIIKMNNDVFASTILLAVQEFRHFFGTL